jgi:hypothetical protein
MAWMRDLCLRVLRGEGEREVRASHAEKPGTSDAHTPGGLDVARKRAELAGFGDYPRQNMRLSYLQPTKTLERYG